MAYTARLRVYRSKLFNRHPRFLILLLVLLGIAAGGAAWWGVNASGWPERPGSASRSSQPAEQHDHDHAHGDDHDHEHDHGHDHGHEGVVQLTPQEVRNAGIRSESVERLPLTDSVWVTGAVALNEDRVAHIYPLVEGRIDSVLVNFGAEVEAGQLLAVVQSKEVGQAKLELYQDRQAREFARVKYEWARLIHDNTQQLIAALEQGMAVDAIEQQFRDRPMGDYREKLLSAYANLYKSQADYERLEPLAESGVAPAKQFTAAKAAREADRATFDAALEQVKFGSQQYLLEAQQALQAAGTRVSTHETYLEILGFNKSDLASIAPEEEGEALAHYPIVAPFAGTILVKDAVLLERVSPDRRLFDLADLSTVWIKANVFEQHLPRLQDLRGREIRIRTNVWSGEEFTARVFFTGEMVDEQSRTIGMTAVADNAQRMLKPGMFVEVELPGSASEMRLQIPRSAVHEHEGKPFAFVLTAESRYERRDITPGRRHGEYVEILDGLHEGEQVVVAGGFVLKSHLLADLIGDHDH